MLRGRVLVILTEQLPRSKDALGLVFQESFALIFRGLRDANARCTTLGHHDLVPALSASAHRENPERAYADGGLASGRLVSLTLRLRLQGWKWVSG